MSSCRSPAVIKARLRRTAEDVIEIGLALKRVKATLPHGQFGRWIDAEFGWDARAAQRFMQVAEVYGAKTSVPTHLSFDALVALTAPATPDDVRAAIEERVAAGELVTAAEVPPR